MSLDAPEPFQIDVESRRDTTVVAVRGEVDMTTAGELEERLREALAGGAKRLALDLRRVTFMDSTGLRTVLDVRSASREASAQFALIRGPEAVERLFELTGAEQALQFVEPEQLDAPWD